MSRQLDVVANPATEDAGSRPFLLILQSDLVSGLTSTVVAPLVYREQMSGATRMNPLITVEGCEYWLAMHELFAVDKRILPTTAVASLATQREVIIGALDFLFAGY